MEYSLKITPADSVITCLDNKFVQVKTIFYPFKNNFELISSQ